MGLSTGNFTDLMSVHRFLSCLAAAAAMTFALSASAATPLRVVTSFYPVYVAALNVTAGVEGIEIRNLASPRTGCLHDYQLTTSDARRLADAGLFLANGAGMETFLEKIRTQYPHLPVAEVSKGVPLMDENPHVWVSPDGARRQVENIAAALSAADPSHAERYTANAADYNAKLSALEARMKSALAPFAGTSVVALHESFPYFARDFGLEIAGVIEGEPGREPSAGALAHIVGLMREKKVKLLLTEPQSSDRTAQILARETGAEVCLIDTVATGPNEPERAREAYLHAMEQNLGVLQNALRR